MKGRPPMCPYCKSKETASKGYRKTVTLGLRKLRKCKKCGKKFTLKSKAIKPKVSSPKDSCPETEQAPQQAQVANSP